MEKLPQARTRAILMNILSFIDDNSYELKEEIYNYMPKDLRDDFLYALETENYE